MLPETTRVRLLKLLLRAGGVLLTIAFAAVFLPAQWMAESHRWLGLGEFPAVPIVDYLTRSVSALYGFHGILVLIVSTDPVKYRAIVSYIAGMNVVFGAMMLAIDVHADMPLYWTLIEGPAIASTGLLVGLLNRQPA